MNKSSTTVISMNFGVNIPVWVQYSYEVWNEWNFRLCIHASAIVVLLCGLHSQELHYWIDKEQKGGSNGPLIHWKTERSFLPLCG